MKPTVADMEQSSLVTIAGKNLQNMIEIKSNVNFKSTNPTKIYQNVTMSYMYQIMTV